MAGNRRPVQHPDIPVDVTDLPLTFPIDVRANGRPLDARFYQWLAPVTDDGKIIGWLNVGYADAAAGKFELTLDEELWVKLKSYSTWQLRETSTFKGALAQGRFVKAITT